MKDLPASEPSPAPLARDRARQLRRSATDAERRLWLRLRSARLHGAKFRRQHPLGPYIADFFCLAARLVVELDGGGHDAEAQRRADAARTAYLESCGYRVLRFWNNEVIDNIDGVVEKIAEYLLGPSPGASRRPLPTGRGTEKWTER